MRLNSIEIFTNPIETGTVEDYKIALTEADDLAGRAGYLYEHKINAASKLENKKSTDPDDLVYCSLDNEKKIVLSPKISDGMGTSYEINVDSFPFNEVNTQFWTYRSYSHTSTNRVVFPIQIATGYIKDIQILFGQPGGGSFENASVAIYGNDKPTVIGSRLMWGSSNIAWNKETGIATFEGDNRPIIPGYSEVGTEKKPNTFFYCLLSAIGSNDGGYRLAAMVNNNLSILRTTNNNVKVVGRVPSFDGNIHNTFDYTVDDSDLNTLPIPYINFTMNV